MPLAETVWCGSGRCITIVCAIYTSSWASTPTAKQNRSLLRFLPARIADVYPLVPHNISEGPRTPSHRNPRSVTFVSDVCDGRIKHQQVQYAASVSPHVAGEQRRRGRPNNVCSGDGNIWTDTGSEVALGCLHRTTNRRCRRRHRSFDIKFLMKFRTCLSHNIKFYLPVQRMPAVH